jgi:hypothetical protein
MRSLRKKALSISVAQERAKVLDEPVKQRGEVERIGGGLLVRVTKREPGLLADS